MRPTLLALNERKIHQLKNQSLTRKLESILKVKQIIWN